MTRFPIPGAAIRRGTHVLAILPALLLAACGGGGGGGDSPEPTPGPAPAVIITQANAEIVAASALDSATSSAAGRVATDLVLAVEVQTATPTGAAPLARVTRKLLGMVPASPARATGVEVNETLQCELGGTITVRGSVADSSGQELQVGDSVSIATSNCRAEIEPGVVSAVNGRLSIRVASGRLGAHLPYDVVLATTADNLRVQAGSETALFDGDMRIALTVNSASDQSMILTGDRLMTSTTVGGQTRSATWLEYRQAVLLRDGTTRSILAGDIEVTSPRLGASTVGYTVSTPAAVVVANANGDVLSGSLLVQGRNSRLLLTVPSTNSFRLQVDADGNGSYESSRVVTLAQLRAQL
jgi:hypothetical protein